MMATIYGEDVRNYESNLRLRVAYRLVSTIPPIVGAIFVRELGLITAYAGLFSIATAFVFPPLLYIRSKAISRKAGFGKQTCYENVWASTTWASIIFFCSSVSILYVFLSLIHHGTE
mmetsp:Transcript_18382/g.52679  ORF Transcript_18382/g.52679 Transcript_18382/m.52679 type:complete len:117 (+) Transcript_18382:452-802(+)